MNTTKKPKQQNAASIPACFSMSDLQTLSDTSIYLRNEDGDFIDRPCIEVRATLSHETENYIRIIKNLAGMYEPYMAALVGTYGESKGRARYAEIIGLFIHLRDEIAHDMGVCMGERLSEWKDNYI